jgi:transcriptional regulator with XRE-family HTH domain
MSEWFSMLVDARVRLGVSQSDLAALSHVSLPSVKAYEQGKRHPSRPYLKAMLDALKLTVMERNAILAEAGFAPDGKDVVPDLAEYGFTMAMAQQEVDSLAWPAFVLNDALEVICYSRLTEQVWSVDIAQEFPDASDRSLLSFASDPRFADRVLNWEEAVGTMASVFKGHFRGAENLDDPSPAFGRILQKLLAGDAEYVARFFRLWQIVPEAEMRIRWHYPMVWNVPGIGAIDFDCVVSNCNHDESWSFNEWIPKDVDSWRVLESLKAGLTA